LRSIDRIVLGMCIVSIFDLVQTDCVITIKQLIGCPDNKEALGMVLSILFLYILCFLLLLLRKFYEYKESIHFDI